jgi:hypothetical protein
MKILHLLEEIQKFSGEDIEFWTINRDGEMIKKLDLFISDGRFVFGTRDVNDNFTDTIIVGFNE